MNRDERIKMFTDVFAPQADETVLFLVDQPHDAINDTAVWKARREMAHDWYTTFQEMGEKAGFTVALMDYPATGAHNAPLPQNVIDAVKTAHLFLAMTEYSGTASLIPVSKTKGSITRGASMPGVEKRMEETAFLADYAAVQRYATALEHLLNDAVGAEVLFSTGDQLYLDLRNRVAESDRGDCTKAGQTINFPSGEAWKVPYEGAADERGEFGASKTAGVLPVDLDGELVKCVVKENKIVEVQGEGAKAEELRGFFAKDETHRNLAELGIGCNPHAVVTGNILEDEKVGLHIAYGMSAHLGGRVKSDMHQDICYPKGCPVEGTTVTLHNKDGSQTTVIQGAQLRYELLK